MGTVLGLSGQFHDAAAAVVVDGVVVAAAQEERFTRRKHDASLPIHAVRSCLRQAGRSLADVDLVVWHEKPLVKLERILTTTLRTWPRGFGAFRRAMASMVGDKLWVKQQIVHRLGVAPEKVQFSAHHLSHAASAFYASPFDDAAVLCVDGVGEWAATTSWTASRDDGLRADEQIDFPHSLGLLYSVFTAFLGFEVNDGESKIMGLAAYGQPRFLDAMAKVVDAPGDGSVTLRLEHFAFHHDADCGWRPSFAAIFGEPRAPGAPLTDHHRDLAATIQRFTEEQMLALARRVHARTGRRHLCLAGGVALNAVAVGRIIAEGPFEDVYVHPAAGDAGAALGAAVLGAGGTKLGMRGAGWGEDVGEAAARTLFQDAGVSVQELDEARLPELIADRLAAGEVVGWMQGRAEWGPRALGHRSILADPRLPDVRERLNRQVKYREPFRPFAPSVLAEDADALFVRPPALRGTEAFMTSVVRTRDGRVPSAMHVDGTARVQVVGPDAPPAFGALLRAFKARTGVGCLVNTSFNLAGEPIVNTAADGWGTLLRCGMDTLVVGTLVVTR